MHYDLSVFRGPAEGLRDDRRLSRLDLDATREILLAAEMEVDGDELIWARDALVAQFLLSTDGDGRLLAIEGGVVTEDAPRELRAREFRALLAVLQKAARELDARLYDHQLGRFLVGDHDVEEAVAGFA